MSPKSNQSTHAIIGIGLDSMYHDLLNQLSDNTQYVNTISPVLDHSVENAQHPTILVIDCNRSLITHEISQLPELMWPWSPRLITLSSTKPIRSSYAQVSDPEALQIAVSDAIASYPVLWEPSDPDMITLEAVLAERVSHMLRLYRSWFQSLSPYPVLSQSDITHLYTATPGDTAWLALGLKILAGDTGRIRSLPAPDIQSTIQSTQLSYCVAQFPQLLNQLKSQWLPFRFRRQLLLKKLSDIPDISIDAVYELFPDFKLDTVSDPPILSFETLAATDDWLHARLNPDG